ncbi:MAG: hypothetical protein ACREC0_03155 [Methylocella sp.]
MKSTSSTLKFDSSPPAPPAPEDGTALLDSLDAALQALAVAEEPLHRMGDRLKVVALETARQ